MYSKWKRVSVLQLSTTWSRVGRHEFSSSISILVQKVSVTVTVTVKVWVEYKIPLRRKANYLTSVFPFPTMTVLPVSSCDSTPTLAQQPGIIFLDGWWVAFFDKISFA